MIRNYIRGFLVLGMICCQPVLGSAQSQAFDPLLNPLEQSKAYQVYKTRTHSELSKLIYLIDRFQTANMKIVYDGIEYQPGFVARMARWFLPSHYHGESAEKWIMVWCNKSYSFRQLIWVKDSKDNCKLAREILLDELKQLDAVKVQQAEAGSQKSAA